MEVKKKIEKEYRYIIHISDIHIRLNYRHDEYKEVFQNLYKNIDEKNLDYEETLIVITGDLLHDKTTLTSEAIILCTDFLNNLSKRYKTILIAGNHDGFLNTDEKIDMITGVIHGKEMNNLYYYKNNNIVRFKNIVFGISSVFDESIIPSSFLDQFILENDLSLDTIKIGLYHGMIGTVKLQNLYDSKGGLSVEDFKGYDYLLLGDIHRFQYLNDEKTIAYASSLVSQNFSEYDLYHGYLLWDLKDKKSEFNFIKNDYQYKKAFLNNEIFKVDDKEFNIMDNIEEIKEYLPKKGRVQVILEDNNFEKMRFLKNKLKDIYWVELNNILNKYDENKKKNKINVSNNLYINRRDIIKEILKTKYEKNIDENIIDWIDNEIQNNDIKTSRDGDKFEILKLKFDNLFVYGENNEIDLTKFNEKDTILICGKNSSGKSSLIDIIVFNLYNDYAREVSSQVKKSNSGILNNEKNEGYSELLIRITNEYYIVRREYKKNKKNLIETDSYLYKLILSNEVVETETIKKNKNNKFEKYIYNGIEYKTKLLMEGASVNKEIIKMIGTKDNFMLMNMMMQNDNISFKNMNQTERKKMLIKLLELEKYDKMKLNMEENRKKINKEYDIIKNDMDKIDIDAIKELIKNNSSKIDDLNIRSNEKTNEIESIQNKITKLNIDYVPIQTNILENEFKIIESIKKLKDDNILLEKNIEEYKNKIEDYENKYENKKENKEDNKESQLENIDIINNKIDELNNNLENNIRKISKLYDTKYRNMEELDNEYNEITKNLKNNIIEEYNNKKEEYEIFLKKYQNKERDINNKIEVNNEKIKGLINGNTKNEYEKMNEEKYKNNEILLERMDKDITTYEYNIEKNEKELKIKRDRLKILMENKNKDKDNLIEERYDKVLKIKELIVSYDNQIDTYKKIMEEFSSHEYNPECEKCMKNPKVVELKKFEFLINDLTEKKSKIENDLVEYKNIEEEMNSLTNNNNEIKSLNNIIDNLLCENNDLRNKFNKCKDEVMKIGNEQKYFEIKKIINELKNDKVLIAFKNMIDENIKELTNMEEIIKQNKIVIDKIELMEKEKDLIKKNQEIIKENNIIEENILKIKEELVMMKNKKTKIENDTKDYMKLKIDYNDIKNRFDINNVHMDGYNKEMEKIKIEKDKKEMNKKIEDEIDMLKIINKKRVEEVNKIKEEIIKLNEENKIKNKIKDEYDSNKNKFILIQYEKDKYEYYKDVLDKNGLPLYLIKTYLEFITDGINEIIGGQIDKKVRIYEEDEKINIEIKDINGELVEFMGGMENFITEISFKIVLSKIMEMNRGNIIIIDEGVSALDREQMSKIDDLFNFINGHYEYILLMSHIEEIKDKVNNKIYIKKENGLSKIV